MVLGDSQNGKTSFLVEFSGVTNLRVGSGDGLSCTKVSTALVFPDRWHLFEVISCDDIPGFNDTGLQITNGKIMETLRMRVAGLSGKQVNALLVFQSLASDRINLAKTLQRVQEKFGPESLRSVIVMLTKSDLISAKFLKLKMGTIEEITNAHNIPYVIWVNNSPDYKVPEEQMQQQIDRLRSALQQVQSYPVTDLKLFEEQVEIEAQRLMNADEDNRNIQQYSVPTQVVEVSTKTEMVPQPTVVPQFATEEEVKREAQRIATLPQNRRIEECLITETTDEADFDIVVEERDVYSSWNSFLGICGGRTSGSIPVYRKVSKVVPKVVSRVATREVQAPSSEFEEVARGKRTVALVDQPKEVQDFQVKNKAENVEITTLKRDMGRCCPWRSGASRTS